MRSPPPPSPPPRRGPLSLFVLVVLLAAPPLAVVDAFAAWLKCYVDLDESEVIMNHQVLPPDESDPVRVEVRVVVENDGGGGGGDDNDEWRTSGITYPSGIPMTVQARLRLPDKLRREEIEYVIETTKGGVFVPPKTCEGVRSHAKNQLDEVTLRIDGSESQVELWAGWAPGHGPVSLTPKTILRREGVAGDTDTEL